MLLLTENFAENLQLKKFPHLLNSVSKTLTSSQIFTPFFSGAALLYNDYYIYSVPINSHYHSQLLAENDLTSANNRSDVLTLSQFNITPKIKHIFSFTYARILLEYFFFRLCVVEIENGTQRVECRQNRRLKKVSKLL